MNTEINRRFIAPIATGGALIIAGSLFALQQAGYLQFLDLTRSWPVLVIALALLRLGATLNEPRQRGWALLLLGDWLFANTMTDWAYAAFMWPLLLTGFGALMIFRAINQRHASEYRDELQANHHVL